MLCENYFEKKLINSVGVKYESVIPVLVDPVLVVHYIARTGIDTTSLVATVYLFPSRAAVTIQREYRKWKNGQTLHGVPPPSTPATVGRPATTSRTIGRDSLRLDYDTYLENLRPGSTMLSDISTQRIDLKSQVQY